MSRHECKGAECSYCEDRIDAVIEERAGMSRDHSKSERDKRADGAGADMVFGREW